MTVSREIEFEKKMIGYIEERAREAGITHSWLIDILLNLGMRKYDELYPRVMVNRPTMEEINLMSSYTRGQFQLPPPVRKYVKDRDNNTCQYCGSKEKIGTDHIIPKCRGGSHDFDNIVACCKSCNSKKGGRTPEEAGMRLAKRPKAEAFTSVEYIRRLRHEQRTNDRQALG